MSAADVLLIRADSVVLFTPITAEACRHFAEKFPADCAGYGGAFVVELRAAPAILADLEAIGFVVERGEQ